MCCMCISDVLGFVFVFFFFKQKTAYEMRISDWSSDVCSSDLREERGLFGDLYALSGRFVAAIRMKGLRLPEDLIGDDGLVAAWAHTDLGRDVDWRREIGRASCRERVCQYV